MKKPSKLAPHYKSSAKLPFLSFSMCFNMCFCQPYLFWKDWVNFSCLCLCKLWCLFVHQVKNKDNASDASEGRKFVTFQGWPWKFICEENCCIASGPLVFQLWDSKGFARKLTIWKGKRLLQLLVDSFRSMVIRMWDWISNSNLCNSDWGIVTLVTPLLTHWLLVEVPHSPICFWEKVISSFVLVAVGIWRRNENCIVPLGLKKLSILRRKILK